MDTGENIWGDRGSGGRAGRPTFSSSIPVRSLHYTSPTLPRVNVSDCCMFEVVVGEAVGAEWQPHFHQSAPGQLWLLL